MRCKKHFRTIISVPIHFKACTSWPPKSDRTWTTLLKPTISIHFYPFSHHFSSLFRPPGSSCVGEGRWTARRCRKRWMLPVVPPHPWRPWSEWSPPSGRTRWVETVETVETVSRWCHQPTSTYINLVHSLMFSLLFWVIFGYGISQV